jgi:hypothetical protein
MIRNLINWVGDFIYGVYISFFPTPDEKDEKEGNG